MLDIQIWGMAVMSMCLSLFPLNLQAIRSVYVGIGLQLRQRIGIIKGRLGQLDAELWQVWQQMIGRHTMLT